MISAILYKEWLKTYKIIILFLVVFTISILNTFFDAKNTVEFYETTNAILNITIFARFKYNFIDSIPLLFAVSLGTFQFYPEVVNARIRLFLHLPLSHFKLTSTLIFSGLILLLIIFTIVIYSYYLILSSFYPIEVYDAIYSKLVPIFLAAILAYLSTLLAFLEPKVIRKVLYTILSFFILSVYLKYSQTGYFVSDFLNITIIFIILIYIISAYEVFTSYTKGYIK